MQKNNMQKITHDNAIAELLKRIPELKISHNFDEFELSQPTIVFDHFGDFLLEKINSHSADNDVIKRSFDLINEMMEAEDPHTQNLPVVGVFEVVAGSKKGIEVAEQYLNSNGREWLNKVKQNFNAQ